MNLDLRAALLVFVGVAAWRWLRSRPSRASQPFPDVPDAAPDAEPLEAPGMTLPYSSLDPTAPPKRFTD